MSEKQGAGGGGRRRWFLSSQLLSFLFLVAHPSLLLPIFSAHRSHACLLALTRSLRLQNGKETSATRAAWHRIPDPYSPINSSSRTKVAEVKPSYKRQSVTHLFRCDWSTALLFFSVFFLQKLYFLLTKKKKCFIRHRHKTSCHVRGMFCAQLISKPKEPLQKQSNVMGNKMKTCQNNVTFHC